MRDVSPKANTLRSASAEAMVRCLPATVAAVRTGAVPKADPIGVAKVAGIMAAKNTSLLIPYCHQVPLDYVRVDIEIQEHGFAVRTEAKAVWKTGVEMEALVAASGAALTLYDMLKIIDGTMQVESIRLLAKQGGKSDAEAASGEFAAAILVVSDSTARGERQDRSGRAIAERLKAHGVRIAEMTVLPDDPVKIEEELIRLADALSVDLVITSGGTGLGPRDSTPEATARVIVREVPGIVEALRAHGLERTRHAMLSRAVAGVRGKTLIVNLPGSTNAAMESMDLLFPWLFHSYEVMRGGGHEPTPGPA